MAESIVFRKQVHGEVEFNDGEFAEIQTLGIEGIEKDLRLQTIQVHRGDTEYSCEQFQNKVPVGSWLTICTTIEVTKLELELDSDTDVDTGDYDKAVRQQKEGNSACNSDRGRASKSGILSIASLAEGVNK